MHIDQIFCLLHYAVIFTQLDLHNRYYHISPNGKSEAKGTFIANHAKYEFCRLPFSLKVVPRLFSKLLSQILEMFEFCYALPR